MGMGAGVRKELVCFLGNGKDKRQRQRFDSTVGVAA